MKKLLVISNMYPTAEHLSYGIFVKNQVEQLEKDNIDILLAVNDNPATGKVNVLKKYARWALQTIQMAKRHKKELSITHSHYVFPSGLLSYMLKKRYGIPYIVTAHGGDINKMAKKSERIRQYTEKILQNADYVIAVGEELAQTIEVDFHIPKDKITVMSMGIDRAVFTKPNDRKSVATSLKMDPQKMNFLFVGNIIQEKGVEELIGAFNELTNIYPEKASLYCIGSTKDTNFVDKVKLIAKGNEHIHFIEPMQQQQLAQYFQAADVFVLPSYIEGLGLVALEAMACGTPVLASDVGGLHYMLKNGAGVVVPPKDQQALLAELQKAVEKSSLKVDEQQVEKLLETHDAKNIIEKLKAIYSQYAK